jgi:type I restriction enzyme R subunit
MNEVAEQLVDLMEELKNEKDSFDELGINYEEKAFYDVLVGVEDKYEFDFPDDKNVEIAKQIYQIISDKAKYADWNNRGDIRAE